MTQTGSGLADATSFLVYALAALYVLAAIAGPVFLDYGAGRDALWIGFLAGGAALMVIGHRYLAAPRVSAAVVSIGAAAGGFPLFWTLIVPVAVAAVIASSIALARRASAQA